MLYTILITSRKLRHYFEYYKIAVVTEFPLGDILRNKEANGRIIKWAVELGTYSIEFRSRPTIKSQALADFVAEWTEIQEPIAVAYPEHWVMYFDDALNIMVLVWAFYSLRQPRISYIMFFGYTSRPPTTSWNTKHVSMVFV